MAYVQGDKASSASTAALTTPGITTTSGNFLIAVVSVNTGPRTVSSFTDSLGNTWTGATGNPQTPNGGFNVYVFYAKNITGGASHTFTANFNAAGLSALGIIELSGRHLTSPIEFQSATVETTGATSHSSAATGTLSQSGCDMVCLQGDNAQSQAAATETYTATSSGWTLPASSNVNTGATTATCFAMYRENVDTSSQQATWTNSAGNLKSGIFILAIAPAAAATKSLRNKLQTLGVGA